VSVCACERRRIDWQMKLEVSKLECVPERESCNNWIARISTSSLEWQHNSGIKIFRQSVLINNVQILVLGPSLEEWGSHSVAVGSVNAGGTPFTMGLVRGHTTLERSLCYQAHSTGSHSHDRAR
jgi:hypothetical protein